jgi:hypothetical protein
VDEAVHLQARDFVLHQQLDCERICAAVCEALTRGIRPEIAFDQAEWTIPAEKMKMRRATSGEGFCGGCGHIHGLTTMALVHRQDSSG